MEGRYTVRVYLKHEVDGQLQDVPQIEVARAFLAAEQEHLLQKYAESHVEDMGEVGYIVRSQHGTRLLDKGGTEDSPQFDFCAYEDAKSFVEEAERLLPAGCVVAQEVYAATRLSDGSHRGGWSYPLR